VTYDEPMRHFPVQVAGVLQLYIFSKWNHSTFIPIYKSERNV